MIVGKGGRFPVTHHVACEETVAMCYEVVVTYILHEQCGISVASRRVEYPAPIIAADVRRDRANMPRGASIPVANTHAKAA